MPKNKLFQCPYNIACTCDMMQGCNGCEDFNPELFVQQQNSLPTEVVNFLSNAFVRISKGQGAIDKVMQYGGAAFVKFKNRNVYRFSLQLYNDTVCLDSKNK